MRDDIEVPSCLYNGVTPVVTDNSFGGITKNCGTRVWQSLYLDYQGSRVAAQVFFSLSGNDPSI